MGRIIPVLAILFLCSFLDRTNVGNARLYHLEADLRMTDHQYDIGLAVFYATYIIRFVAAVMEYICVYRRLIRDFVVRCPATWF